MDNFAPEFLLCGQFCSCFFIFLNYISFFFSYTSNNKLWVKVEGFIFLIIFFIYIFNKNILINCTLNLFFINFIPNKINYLLMSYQIHFFFIFIHFFFFPFLYFSLKMYTKGILNEWWLLRMSFWRFHIWREVESFWLSMGLGESLKQSKPFVFQNPPSTCGMLFGAFEELHPVFTIRRNLK